MTLNKITEIMISTVRVFCGVTLVTLLNLNSISCRSNTKDSIKSDAKVVNVSDLSMDLISLYHKNKIIESPKKSAFIGIMDESLFDQFNDIGYGYRIKEHSEKWRFFEDGKYWILFGSVSRSEDESAVFVWLWEDNGKKVTYLSVGNNVLFGVGYPEGIIPYK
jgi:hypothetical protein